MSRTVRFPNTGSIFGSSACVVQSQNTDVWLGLTTPITSSGCATFYRSNSAVAGCEIGSIIQAAGQFNWFPVQINSPCGIFISTGSGGSAMALVKRDN